MARKFCEENERIKRQDLTFLREAKRCDATTVDKAADAILRFERSTGYKTFKRFKIEQATTFKRQLEADRNTRTGKPLAKATIDGTLRAVKAFLLWLAGQPGYKSRISYSDAEYFNLNAKDARKALADIDDFAAKGLPQFTSVASHGNKVLSQISGMISKISNDTAGFLLGGKK